ncbi:MAG: ribonuclease P protein component [Firmicutes bacterium]|uniref:Ribonuclease P protein component n=1 Tax=Candidatus Scybalomonas excrementavium TaxID=2840943 RepID=A0A9D9HYQ2_9FIRM|nr:ribonuclease P protein component [Candidatus Scybalomonas excrementavium]
MKHFESLKKNKDFVTVYQSGKSLANRYLVMYKKKNNLEYNRVGISVSKKVGNSVIRHRVTRLIRESNRLHADEIEVGYDLVIVARPSVKGKGFLEVESAFLHLAKLHHLLIEVNQSENC